LPDELFEPVAAEPLLPLVPVEPVLPPCVCAKETAATEPISNAAIVLEREMFMSPPCQSRTSLEDVREQINQDEQTRRNAKQPSNEILTHKSSVIVACKLSVEVREEIANPMPNRACAFHPVAARISCNLQQRGAYTVQNR
jgi:hypothetical protein